MAGPGDLGRGILGPGVQAHRPLARGVGGADGQPQYDATLHGQGQRDVQGQFRDPRAAELVGGHRRHLHVRGAGQQRPAQHGVFGQPGGAVGGQPSGEQEPGAVRQLHRGTQQRVPDLLEADRRRVRRALGCVQPVPRRLEGVGRQLDRTHVPVPEERRPVHAGPAGPAGAAGVDVGQGAGQRRHLVPVGAQHGDERRCRVVRDDRWCAVVRG